MQKDITELGLAEPYGIPQDGLEHRLQPSGRGADDAQNLRCGFLSLQRLVALTGKLSNGRSRFVVGRRWIAATSRL